MNAAKEQKQRISPNLVAETAGKFVEASNTNPSAWNAALELISYRSSLNSPPAAAPSAHGSPAPRNSYVLHLDPDSGFDLPNVYLAGGSASPEDSARLESLTIRPPDRLNGTGSRFAILQGGAVVLDDEYMKNVIIRDEKVVYWGGKTRLENVYFLNCTFDIPQAPSGQNFAKAVLSSTPSNFSNV